MELTVFGISILLLLIVWHHMIRRTVIDATRDKLFDIRDEVRQTFKERGWDMGSDTYRSLRDLMNGYLRFTEEYSFWKFLYLEASVLRDKRLQLAIDERSQKRFLEVDKEQREFVGAMRNRAVHAVLEFSVYSSGLLLALSMLLMPFVLISKVVAVVRHGFGAAGEVFKQASTHLGKSFLTIFESSAAVIYGKLFKADFFESYSYRIGTA